MLALDAAASLLFVLGAVIGIEAHFPHHFFRVRFSLKSLVVATAWIGICAYWLKGESNFFWSYTVINAIAFFIFVVALGLCCLTAVDLIGIAFNWATKRRK